MIIISSSSTIVVIIIIIIYTVYMGMDVSFTTELYNNMGIAGMHPEVAPPLAYSIDMEYRQFFRRKSSLKMLVSTCMLVDGRVASFHWVGFKEITLDQWKPPSFTRCSWKKHLVFLQVVLCNLVVHRWVPTPYNRNVVGSASTLASKLQASGANNSLSLCDRQLSESSCTVTSLPSVQIPQMYTNV